MSLAARFALIFLGSAAWLGLAVLGWGGAPFFSDSARITLVIVTFLVAVAAMFAGGSLSPGVREDRRNRWVLGVFGIVGLLDGFVPAYTDRIGFWTINSEAIRWVGVALFAVGCGLRLWPVFVLGRRFSGLVAIQSGHTLVTTGIYSIIRHPSYLGMMLMVLGWALVFRSVAGLVLLASMLPPLVGRIRAEERLLESAFGDEYRGYVRHTSRLVPGVY